MKVGKKKIVKNSKPKFENGKAEGEKRGKRKGNRRNRDCVKIGGGTLAEMGDEEQLRATQQWIVEDDDDDTLNLTGMDDSDVESGKDDAEGAEGFTEDPKSLQRFLDMDEDDDLDPTRGILDHVLSDDEFGKEKNTVGLLEEARAIIPTRKNPMKRKEAAKNVEEFSAVKRRINVGDGGVNKFLESVKQTGDTKTAEKVAKLQAVTENEKSLKKKRIKTLDAPTERITSEKIKRTLLYDNAKEEVSKWNSVVYHNRTAEQLVFPLSEDNKSFKKPQKNKDGSEFIPVTPLEEEIAKVLYGEDYVQRKKAEMAKDPEKTDLESYMLSVEEAMATHSEMAKLRALQSYAMAKSKRQNKIKSKKYHRLLRKSKIKQQMKEFEELQKKDPEAALVKLEELERARVQERMSLKHRNTSKWAKMHAARAKYDKDSRMALSEQLKISRDLTQKLQESSESEDDEDMELPLLVKSSVENPWMLKPSLQDNEKLQMYYTGYKKFWDEYNRQMQKRQINENEDNASREEEGDDEVEGTDMPKSSNNLRKSPKDTKGSRRTDGDVDEFREINVNEEEINSEGVNADSELDATSLSAVERNLIVKNNERQDGGKKALEVDPDNFLKVTKASSSITPQFSAQNSQVVDLLEESEDSDDETDQRNLIAEAFEDDDVVNEFYKQKKEAVDASKPQEIDNFLPGWGSWTGKNIVPIEKKRRKFVKKPKKGPPRKDARVSHVIINEDVDAKVRVHQVKEVPFPFTRVKDFEKTVRAPIGRNWMPESAVKSLTAPKIITRLGQTIKPISENVLAKSKEKTFHVPNTIIRMAKVTSKK